MTITAAADGSSLGNPGPTGWAWYIDDAQWAAGGFAHGTNNIGELTAVAELLDATAAADEPLRILCDSKYVIDSCTKWMPGWKRNGWKKKDGKPVLNVELMQRLDAALRGRDVTFEWVKGHAGHRENEAADVRANAAATAFQAGKAPKEGPGFRGAAPAQATAATPTPAPEPTPAPTPVPPAAPAPERDDEPDALFALDDACAVFTSVEADVAALERRSLEGGREALDELAHPGYEQVAADGAVRSRAEAIATARALRPDSVRAISSGPTAVLVLGDVEWRAGRLTTSSLWAYEAVGPGDGQWRLRFRQFTPVR